MAVQLLIKNQSSHIFFTVLCTVKNEQFVLDLYYTYHVLVGECREKHMTS